METETKNKTYSEKLKDPRWQRKRLKILERDNWTCLKCNSKDETLHVHHLVYIKGWEPWDYLDTMLVTLCWQCHEEIKDFNIAGFILEWIFRGYDPRILYDHIFKFIDFPLDYPLGEGWSPSDLAYDDLWYNSHFNVTTFTINNG